MRPYSAPLTLAAKSAAKEMIVSSKGPVFTVSTMSDIKTGDTKSAARITIRLAERELELIRRLARERNTDMAAVVREAIAAYFDRAEDRAVLRTEHDRLIEALRHISHQEADRIVAGYQQAIRSLIAALNEQLARR